MTVNRLHAITEVAEILGISKNDAYALVRHDHLKALKLGRLKVSTFELEDFMKRNVNKDFSYLNNVTDLKFPQNEKKTVHSNNQV
ncbi:helix-turn-helix domain-containing protein [Pseudogracilibacillus sp. SO30301A]|uniref:helix-turn-helix domain-containing protein n=1 Tax=Pseudogracilibacillus sp. SO30301A TaxID=3098291 RepID=UPI00300E40C5